MPIAFGAKGTTAYGSGASVSPSYPSGITAGQLLIVAVVSRGGSNPIRFPTAERFGCVGEFISTVGTPAADTGPARITLWAKIATGSETGIINTINGNTSTVMWADVYRFTSTTGAFYLEVGKGEDTSSDTGFSVDTVPGPRTGVGWVAPGDLLLGVAGTPLAALTWSAQAFASAGLTIGSATEIAEYATTVGDNATGSAWYAQVTGGTQSSSTVTMSATLSAAIYGAGMVLRIRDSFAISDVAPLVVGNAFARNVGTTAFDVPLPVGIMNGDLLIVNYALANSAAPVTDFAAKGWTVFGGGAVNTRYFGMIGRLYNSADAASVYLPTLSVATGSTAVSTAVRNHSVSNVATDIIQSAFTPRANAGTGITTAPSITTVVPDSLALAMFGEATNALGDWTQTTGTYALLEQQREPNLASVLIEYVTTMYKVFPTAGATGTVVLTYPNALANAAAQHIAIPPRAPGQVVAYDYFDRVIPLGTSAWGTSDSGHLWSFPGGFNPMALVANSAGRQTHNPTYRNWALELGIGLRTDTDMTVVWSLDSLPVGGNDGLRLMPRALSDYSSDYHARITITPTGDISMGLYRADAAVLATEVLIEAAGFTPNSKWTTRVQTFGVNPTLLRGKTWRTGTAEPDWQRAVYDATAAMQVPGKLLVRNGSSGATTGQPSFDMHSLLVTNAVQMPWPPMQIVGTTAILSGASGNPIVVSGAVTHQLSGTTAIVSGASGAVTVVPTTVVHQVSGQTNILSAAEGAVLARHQVSGTTPIVSAAEGSISKQSSVSGTTPIVSGASGDVSAGRAVSGQTNIVSGASGAVTRSSGVSGTTAIVSGAQGTITALHQASGTTTILFTSVGQLLALHTVSGTTIIVSGASGDVTVITKPGAGGFPLPPIDLIPGGPVLTLDGTTISLELTGSGPMLTLTGEAHSLELTGAAEDLTLEVLT